MKHFTFIACLLIANAACAAHEFSGGFVRAGLGGISTQLNVDQSFNVHIPSAVDIYRPAHPDLQGNSIIGLIGGGYIHQFDSRFTMGLEFTAAFENDTDSYKNELIVESSLVILESKVSSTLQNDFALLFKPGVVWGPKTLFYVLLGPRWGNFESSVDSSFSFMGVVSGSGEDKTSGYELGFTAGVGVMHLFTPHFSVGVEYAYTNYSDISSPEVIYNTNDFGGIFATVVDSEDISAITNSLMLDFAYHF